MNRKYINILVLTFCIVMNAALAQEPVVDNGDRNFQRQLYTKASAALASGNTAEFQQLLEQLSDYPLLPYLEYAALSRDLATLPNARVDAFLEQYAGTVIAARLERQWLAELVNANRTAEMIRYYNPGNTTTELTCRVLKARFDNDDASALDAVAPLWNVTNSQPNVCDPVFDIWIQSGSMTPEVGWQRFSNTLKAGQLNLARYIERLLPAREQALAQTFLDVHQNPGRLSRINDFSARDKETTEIILHGLQRLAGSNSTQAMELLDSYASSHEFTESERLSTARFIALRMLYQGYIVEVETLLHNNPDLRSESLADWLLRNALGTQDWTRLIARIPLLPESAQDSERWRYWHARSLMEQDTTEAVTAAQRIYQDLAGLRSYYGFLAAGILGQPYAFVDRPVQASAADLQQLAQLPALERAHELFLLDDETNAIREWDHALAKLNEAQVLAAGKLAADWGWHRNSIQAMIKVSYWDDLQLRFPIAYQDYVTEAVSKHPQLNPFYVFAIARQESAFMTNVVSPAGARGLMQLMPATGRETARDAGIRITDQDLFTPEINIALGSRYLARQLQNFDDNRILAAAAYNAGPSRVSQWLDQTNANIPVDIWIEMIPFAETRGYVQNVLAYTVIYAYRVGASIPMLTEHEATIRGPR